MREKLKAGSSKLKAVRGDKMKDQSDWKKLFAEVGLSAARVNAGGSSLIKKGVIK